ncbi:MAG: hypothetical protein WC203_07330, partial [Candidatus Bathyarchaeia archaeon]|jgi:hypothetical protein
MKDRIFIFFIAIALILMTNCTTDSKSTNLEKGYYHLKRSNSQLKIKDDLSQTVKFTSANLHIIDKDSLEFIGDNNIGNALWGHDKFKYKLKGKKIHLIDGNYKNKIKYSFTPDSLLELEVNTGGFKSLCFDYLVLELDGRYSIAGFQIREEATWEEAGKYINTAFKGDCLNFFEKDSVVLSKPFAKFITNDSTLSDSIFKFQIQKDKILFANKDKRFEITYQYDGIVRLFVDNNVFERLDLVDLKNKNAL